MKEKEDGKINKALARVLNEKRNEIIFNLVADEYTQSQIAFIMGMSRQLVNHIVRNK